MDDFLSYLQGRTSNNKFAAGAKQYGPSGRSAPNIGPSNPAGYMERDIKAKALRNLMLKKMKAGQTGQTASPEFLNPAARSF